MAKFRQYFLNDQNLEQMLLKIHIGTKLFKPPME